MHYATLRLASNPVITAVDTQAEQVLLLDGLLFNGADLVRELDASIAPFDPAVDASIVLAAYRQWGDEAWRRLSGMFAIALWDGRREQLLLVTDQFGYKPLNWRYVDGCLVFASEFAPLLQPEPAPAMDALALLELQTHGDVMPPRTLYAGVSTVPQGQLLRLQRGAAPQLETWFDAAQDVSEAEYERLRSSSVESVLDELDSLLNRSIAENLRQAGTCAIALSGGVDSAILTAIAARKAKVHVVHVSVPQGGGYDERPTAERVARLTGVPLEVVELTDVAYRAGLVATIAAQAMPSWHLQNVGLSLASQRAADLGAGALVCGDTIGAMLSPASQLPWLTLQPARTLLRRLPAAARSFLLKLVSATEGLPLASHAFARYLPLGVQLSDGYARSAREAWGRQAYGFVKNATEQRIHGGKLAELHGYFPRFNSRGDRVAYAHGVEYRTPFGDRAAARFAMNLPYEYLVREGTPKWTIKAVACRYLPREIAFQSKKPWDMPGDLFLKPFATPSFFRGGFCADAFGIGEAALETAVAHWRADHHRLSRMVHTEIWGRLFIRRESEEQVQDWVRSFG